MRVDPFYTNNIASAIGTTNSTIQKLTEEISSGVRVNSLSDDPVAAGQNEQIISQLSKDDTFTSKTATQLEGAMSVADSALGNVISELTSAISKATEGNNGTNSAAGLGAIAQNLSGIFDEVVALGNTSYLGQYIFSGSKTSTLPFTSTGFYNGDSVTLTVTTPNGQSINTNVSGSAIFTSSTGNVMTALANLIDGFNAASASGLSSQSSLIASSITALTTAMNNVSAQRVTLDNSLNRVQAASSAASTEATQLLSAQTNLMQADLAQIAAKLSTSESQQTALSNVLATLGKKSLFDYLS